MLAPFHLVWVNFSKGEDILFLFITLGSYRVEGIREEMGTRGSP